MQSHNMPGWKAMLMAEAPEISQFIFMYDAEVVDPLRIGAGLPNLRRIAFIPNRTMLPLDFGAKTPGWQEFGLFANQPGSEVAHGEVEMGTLAWILFFEWNPLRSAWDAFLAAQEALHPQMLSLTPDLLLPCLFLTRMAAFPLLPADPTSRAAAWIPCFATAHSRLSSLLIGFFVAWLRGNSKASARYRAHTGPAPEYTKEQRDALTLWKATFGSLLLDAIRAAERPEPIIIRGLEAASQQLWTNRSLRLQSKALHLLSGLLPLACWSPQPVTAATLDAGALSSLEKLTQYWKANIKPSLN